MGSDKARPAYVEDVDDSSGRPVRGSRKTAAVKPKVYYHEEPVRDRRKSTKQRRSQSDAADVLEQKAMATAQHVEIQREVKKPDRRKSLSASTKTPGKSSRASSSQENHISREVERPRSSRDPRNFGIPTPTTATRPSNDVQPIPFRPRALTSQTYPRPISVQTAGGGGYTQGPPLSMSAYYQQPPVVTPSYPPPTPDSSYMQYAAPQQQAQYVQPPQYQYAQHQQFSQAPQYTMSPQSQLPSAAQGDGYFAPRASSRPLSARFDPIPRSSTAFEPRASDLNPRTKSVFGGRDSRPRSDYDPAYHDDGYASAADGATVRKSERRGSIRVPSSTAKMSKAEADCIAMPPPPRPTGILRRSTEYHVDPKSDPAVGSYYEREDRSEERVAPRARRPSPSRHSVSYDTESVRVEAANSSRRRQSSHGIPSSADGSSEYAATSGHEARHETKSTRGPKSAYETKMSQAQAYQGASGEYDAKLDQAQAYQDDVGGGPSIPLTAELLRRQQRKHGGSSRGTKSSASRDDSDYKKSATTRTTRSGSGDNEENVTIKVVGQARVMVGGTQIDCADGGEIRVQRQKSLHNGSERSSSEYGARRIEDRQSRVSRPSGQSRMSSSGESYTQTPDYPRQRERERERDRGRDDNYL
ncbi:hypothetical protein MBM_00424 [Drepanopeziza brunnea f. sp. 'multigermtubi' MB_m1]|uniref:Uncharacterized protein n=1 Tax=Marssonina brunnea f. sp. multigermtubi (strain MB_m1) TaxID=1072389 RepID=K1X8B9_MARBU|nr:uncharacterized protein MBM_00424 [Drepanopeziza brunnea f. sp. 'multigermtubi' MB_m1]EKD21311.1 hypothetical protein MBM_00424 [Drepanopeziza brunnea f. sp. 'multigermtubi' MB_m1]